MAKKLKEDELVNKVVSEKIKGKFDLESFKKYKFLDKNFRKFANESNNTLKQF